MCRAVFLNTKHLKINIFVHFASIFHLCDTIGKTPLDAVNNSKNNQVNLLG